MTNRDKLIEEYEDALFALLMDEVAKKEGEEALRLNERLHADPDAAVPEAVQRRCEKTIRNAFAKQRVRKASRSTIKIVQRVCVAAVLAMLLFTTAFAISEDFRVATLNAVIQVFDDRTQITFGTSASDSQAGVNQTSQEDLEYHYNIALEWLPEGYELESGEIFEDGGRDRVSFISSVDGLIEIIFIPYIDSTVYSLNTEDCTQKEVTVQGHSATLYITNDDMLRRRYVDMPQIWSDMTVFWIDEKNQVIANISATNLTEEEILKFAEGVHWRG